MQSLHSSIYGLGATDKTELKDGAAILYNKRHKVITYPLELDSESAVEFILDYLKQGYRFSPQYIPEDTLQILQKKAVVLECKSKELLYYRNSTKGKAPEPYNPTESDFTAMREYFNSTTDYAEKVYTTYLTDFGRLVKGLGKNLTILKQGSDYAIMFQTKDSAYLYYNTIHNITELIDKEHLYFGLHYEGFEFNLPIVIPQSVKSNIQKLPTYTVHEKPSMLETNLRKLYKELKPFTYTDVKDLFKDYRWKPIKGLNSCSVWMLMYQMLEPNSNLMAYTTDNSTYIIEPSYKYVAYGMSHTEQDKELSSFLTSCDIKHWTGKLVPKSDENITSGWVFEFDQDADFSIKLEGKINKSMREADNRLKRSINNGELKIDIITDNHRIQELTKDIIPMLRMWRSEWLSRHKDDTGIDGRKGMSVEDRNFMVYVLHKVSPALQENLDLLLILARNSDNEVIGYQIGIENNIYHIYQQESLTLNKAIKFKGLREFLVVTEGRFFSNRPEKPTICVGGSNLAGLIKFKQSCRPVRIYRVLSNKKL